jgi:hypothetical protein
VAAAAQDSVDADERARGGGGGGGGGGEASTLEELQAAEAAAAMRRVARGAAYTAHAARLRRLAAQVLAPPVVAVLSAAIEQLLRAADWRQPALLLKAARNIVLEWAVGVQERIAAAFLPNARHTDAPLLRALADFVGEEADAVRINSPNPDPDPDQP